MGDAITNLSPLWLVLPEALALRGFARSTLAVAQDGPVLGPGPFLPTAGGYKGESEHPVGRGWKQSEDFWKLGWG